jgi:hypothetical protein
MTMRGLTVRRDDGLPALSWLLTVDAVPKLVCGGSVLVGPNGFFEGAWSSTIDAWDFHKVADVFGSGARLTADGWIVVPPSHTLECVYLLQTKGGAWLASNSLAFLLTASGAALAPTSSTCRMSALA